MRACWNSYINERSFGFIERMYDSLVISFMLFLYGIWKMLFTMNKRNSRVLIFEYVFSEIAFTEAIEQSDDFAKVSSYTNDSYLW